MSIGVTKLDSINIQHIWSTLHNKVANVDKVKNTRNDWFASVHFQDDSNVARKALSTHIFQVRKGVEINTVGLVKLDSDKSSSG